MKLENNFIQYIFLYKKIKNRCFVEIYTKYPHSEFICPLVSAVKQDAYIFETRGAIIILKQIYRPIIQSVEYVQDLLVTYSNIRLSVGYGNHGPILKQGVNFRKSKISLRVNTTHNE